MRKIDSRIERLASAGLDDHERPQQQHRAGQREPGLRGGPADLGSPDDGVHGGAEPAGHGERAEQVDRSAAAAAGRQQGGVAAATSTAIGTLR